MFVLQLHESVSVSSSSLNFSNIQSLGYNADSFIEDPDPRANYKIGIWIRNILNEWWPVYFSDMLWQWAYKWRAGRMTACLLWDCWIIPVPTSWTFPLPFSPSERKRLGDRWHFCLVGIPAEVFRMRVHWFRIRIQHFRLNRVPIRIQGFDDQNWKIWYYLETKIAFF